MRLFVVEAVVRRPARVLLEQPLRERRPDVVVAGCEIQRETGVRLADAFRLIPLALGGQLIAALNGVAGADDESGIGGRGLMPDLLVNAGLRLARAVAQNDEPKVAGSGRDPAGGHREQERADPRSLACGQGRLTAIIIADR